MALNDSHANPRAEGRSLPAGAIKAHDIRRQVDDWADPYLRPEQQPPRPSLCTQCGAIYANHRWYGPEEAPVPKNERGSLPHALCPADRRKRDRLPGGLVRLSGAFFHGHRTTIEELVHNEEQRARKSNPMERILDRRSEDGTLIVETTNPRLAQRIGHALEKAYHGDVTYQWAEDRSLARVSWHRET